MLIDKARHHKLASLVERMLELHKSSPRMPQDKERVKRVPEKASGIEKIESMDRAIAIDRLVYELSRKGTMYGLTEDEIKIVEG